MQHYTQVKGLLMPMTSALLKKWRPEALIVSGVMELALTAQQGWTLSSRDENMGAT